MCDCRGACGVGGDGGVVYAVDDAVVGFDMSYVREGDVCGMDVGYGVADYVGVVGGCGVDDGFRMGVGGVVAGGCVMCVLVLLAVLCVLVVFMYICVVVGGGCGVGGVGVVVGDDGGGGCMMLAHEMLVLRVLWW